MLCELKKVRSESESTAELTEDMKALIDRYYDIIHKIARTLNRHIAGSYLIEPILLE